jgi:hypothetical protein
MTRTIPWLAMIAASTPLGWLLNCLVRTIQLLHVILSKPLHGDGKLDVRSRSH